MRQLCLLVILATAFAFLLTMLTPSGEANYGSARSAGELYKKYCASCHGKDGRAKTFKGKKLYARAGSYRSCLAG